MTETPSPKKIKMMHLVNLMSIAFADNTITDEENNLLIDIAQHLGLTKEEFNICIEHWLRIEEDSLPIAIPESKEDQIAFLKNFTLVMMIDGEIADNEKQYLRNVVEQFGYNSDEILPSLIDMVRQVYFANLEVAAKKKAEDPLFEHTNDESQIDVGKLKLQSKHVADAFDELFLPALRNDEACQYFMIIPNTDTRLHHLTEKQLKVVETAAEKGYGLAQYVLGRYHQVVKPDSESFDKAVELLKAAEGNEIADASWAIATMYLFGQFGPINQETYRNMIEGAIRKGSTAALQEKLEEMVYGRNGRNAEPETVIDIIENNLFNSKDFEKIYPNFYCVLGDAYSKIGDKAKADTCYDKAINLGFFEAYANKFTNKV